MNNAEKVAKYDKVADAVKEQVVRTLGALLSDVWDNRLDTGEPTQLASFCESLRMLISKVEQASEMMERLARG